MDLHNGKANVESFSYMKCCYAINIYKNTDMFFKLINKQVQIFIFTFTFIFIITIKL